LPSEKCTAKKIGNSKGEGEFTIWNSEGMGGNTFWNFQRQAGVKTWKPSVVGYGYFLELPIRSSVNILKKLVIG